MFRYCIFRQSSRYVSNEQSCLKPTGLYDDLLLLPSLLHFFYFIFSAPISFSLCFPISPSLFFLCSFSSLYQKAFQYLCFRKLTNFCLKNSWHSDSTCLTFSISYSLLPFHLVYVFQFLQLFIFFDVLSQAFFFFFFKLETLY